MKCYSTKWLWFYQSHSLHHQPAHYFTTMKANLFMLKLKTDKIKRAFILFKSTQSKVTLCNWTRMSGHLWNSSNGGTHNGKGARQMRITVSRQVVPTAKKCGPRQRRRHVGRNERLLGLTVCWTVDVNEQRRRGRRGRRKRVPSQRRNQSTNRGKQERTGKNKRATDSESRQAVGQFWSFSI